MKKRRVISGVFVAAVLAAVVAGVFVQQGIHTRAQKGLTLDALSPEEAQALSQTRTEQQTALKQGDMANAAVELVDTLHRLPNKGPEALDEAFGVLQLSAFNAAALMPDKMLQSFFEQTLNPQVYPIDGVVRVMAYEILPTYKEYRTTRPLDPKALIEDIRALTASEDPITRAAALYLLSNPYLDEDYHRVVETVNTLAGEYPKNLIAVEGLRRALYLCRNDQAALAQAVNLPEWNDAVRDLLERDPVAQTIRAATEAWGSGGKEAAVDVYLQVAADDPDPRVRYWALNFASERRTAGEVPDSEAARKLETFCVEILDAAIQRAQQCTGSDPAASKLEQAVTEAIQTGRLSLDVARVEEIYFNFLLFSNRYDEAEQWARYLVPRELGEVPFDMNPYTRSAAPMKECFKYLMLQTRYIDAANIVATFQPFYPGSVRDGAYDELAQKLANDAAYGVNGKYPNGKMDR